MIAQLDRLYLRIAQFKTGSRCETNIIHFETVILSPSFFPQVS